MVEPSAIVKLTPAEIAGSSVRLKCPEGRPMVCYLRLTDERGLAVTTPHVELP